MGRVAVVGSGPTGIGAAETLSNGGAEVDLVDASDGTENLRGYPASAPDLRELDSQRAAPPPSASFLGELPAALLRKRVFGSDFVFSDVERGIPIDGPWLPRSLARGGLSNVWGAGCYPLREEDYADWPVERESLRRWFGPATRLLHISGSNDGLSVPYEVGDGMVEVPLGEGADPASPFEALLHHWHRFREPLGHLGLHAGRARLAVRPRHAGGSGACEACGRCLDGCPVAAIWNGNEALAGLMGRGVRYHPGSLVRRWTLKDGQIWLEYGGHGEPAKRLGPYNALFLAAGPISSFRIAVESVPGGAEASARLTENDVIVLPFLFRGRMTHSVRRFTLSEAAVALDPAGALERPSHLQLYRPGGATLGPFAAVIERAPSPIRTLLSHGIARLAVGMLYLHGAQSRSLRLRPVGADHPIRPIEVTVLSESQGRDAVRSAMRRLHAARRHLSLNPIPMARRVGGPGFSAHLGGTLPIRRSPKRLECHPNGRLAGAEGSAPVFVVDLSAFPEMPAQNPTLTGVANAMRVAAGYLAAGR